MNSTTLEKIIFRINDLIITPLVGRNYLGTVTGLENLPGQGPLVVIANHSSFFDHYLLGVILHNLYGKKIYFLTKKESFQNPVLRVWYDAMGAIPVDRENPDRAAYKRVMELLKAGEILVIYPEGTRGPGDHLLEFKPGAFRMAGRQSVPIVPAGINGAYKILPKGKHLPQKFRAGVAFDKLLTYTSAQVKNDKGLETLVNQSHSIIERLVYSADRPGINEKARQKTADFLAGRAEQFVEEALERENNPDKKTLLEKALRFISLGQHSEPDNPKLRIQKARVLGLKAKNYPLPIRILKALKVRRLAEEVLVTSPRMAIAHYILGTWYLEMPSLLGGKKVKARYHFEQAVENEPGDTRYVLGLAKTLIKTGRKKEVAGLLNPLVNSVALDERTQRRQKRAFEMLENLELN
jgi:1-acyl-sn-glycerol-3-phosphate acyltransferase